MDDTALGVMFASGIILALIARFRGKKKQKVGWLDMEIFEWGGGNSLTIRQLLAGGIHAYGRTDGGKSSSMKQLARAIMRKCNSSLLVLCAKQGEVKEWVEICAKAGRSNDLVIIDPDHPSRFNMIRYLSQGPAGVENVVRFIMEARSVIFRESMDSGGESAVWKKYDETAIKFSVIVLRCAGEEVSTSNLQRLLTSAPISFEQLQSTAWRSSYCNQVMQRGYEANKSGIETMDFEEAREYFLGVWPGLGDRTRGSVLMGVTGTLNAMNTGLAREMFGGATNITPQEAIEGRKIVVVNMPPDTFGDVGRLANIGWKYLWQKEVLRRTVTDKSPIAGIWGDESSLWLSDFDSDYLSRCRSYRGFMIYICQSMAIYRKVLPHETGEAVIESLLSNFSHKLMFALGDYQTAEWAANLCGRELQVFGGGSVQHEQFSLFGNGNESHSSSFHEQYEYLIRPEDFMNGLRTGSPVNDCMVDAVLVRSGKPFANGLPLLSVTFDQRDS